MFGVLNLSLTELAERAKNNIPLQINGEEYFISNMVIASDNFVTKAKIIMTSTADCRKNFELDLSAKFSTGVEAR